MVALHLAEDLGLVFVALIALLVYALEMLYRRAGQPITARPVCRSLNGLAPSISSSVMGVY